LFTGNSETAYAWTKLSPEKPIILIIGGSSGSEKINRVVRENVTALLEKAQIIHICGNGNMDETIEVDGYRQYEYVNKELKHVLAVTDYVISRAGSNAIFEFLALNIPMLLIPLSLTASRGDQIDNAKSFVKSGFAHQLMEEDITSHALLQAIDALVDDAPNIKQTMKKHDTRKSQDHVIDLIESMAKTK